jgi:hypothetical protein
MHSSAVLGVVVVTFYHKRDFQAHPVYDVEVINFQRVNLTIKLHFTIFKRSELWLWRLRLF